MRAFLIALIVTVLAGCSGSGVMIRPFDASRQPTIYVEPMDSDAFGLHGKIELYLARHGYDPVSDPAKASMRLKAQYEFAPTDAVATVKLSDAATGDSLYFGEGKKQAFSTFMDPGAVILGCFKRALSDLPRRN